MLAWQSRILLSAATILAVVAGTARQSPAAAPCEAIHFAAGHSSAIVSGLAPADGVTCYTIATGNGQTAHIRVTAGQNAVFSVDGIVDAQDDYSFRTERKTYRIMVGQLMRSNTAEQFAIEVAIK